MRRPPRPPSRPILSPHLVWRIIFVSLLMVAGAFGMFFWAESRGLSLEAARSMAVNTIVVMEIFYMFSLRYVHGTSLTWRGLLGTPAVLVGLTVVVAGQFALTYLPFMQAVFGTEALGPTDGLAIIGAGVALLLLLEAEKRIRRGFSA
jgi:magnesium-transporting ATPase (P-type)